MITPTIAMRRLRAERRRLDTSDYPPRVRGARLRKAIDPQVHKDFERAWAKLMWPAAKIMAWPDAYQDALRYIAWLSWREARRGMK